MNIIIVSELDLADATLKIEVAPRPAFGAESEAGSHERFKKLTYRGQASSRGAIYVQRKLYDDLCIVLKEPLRSTLVPTYNTGIRVEELLRLRWSAVSESGILTLPARGTKTLKQRQIWRPRDFKRKRGQPDDLIFPLA